MPRIAPPGRVSIRPGVYSEAGAIKLVAVTHPYTKHFGHPAYCNRDRFENGSNIVAVVAGRIVGFAAVRFKKRLPETEVDIIGVAPDMRGQGIGAAILDYVMSISPQPSIMLDVMADNVDAIRFYRRYGFSEIGEKYLSAGTAIRMKKSKGKEKSPPPKKMSASEQRVRRIRDSAAIRGTGAFAYADAADLTPVETHGKMWLKRDDLYRAAGAPGGKARTCWALAQDAKGLVAASHRHSPQMSMVARMAGALGIPCRIHTATGPVTPQIEDAAGTGATVVRHSPGYNGVLIARARADAAARGWVEIPFGMESQKAVDLTAAQVDNIPKQAKRIVVAVGIGVSMSGILRGLDKRKLKIPILAIAVGTPHPEKYIERWAPENWRERVTLIHAEESYDTHVTASVDGVLLDPVYEAKCVKYLKAGDLLWIVGIRASSLTP